MSLIVGVRSEFGACISTGLFVCNIQGFVTSYKDWANIQHGNLVYFGSIFRALYTLNYCHYCLRSIFSKKHVCCITDKMTLKIRTSSILLLLFTLAYSFAWDGCYRSLSWKCGDTCIDESAECKCGDSIFNHTAQMWCCHNDGVSATRREH